MAYSNFLEEKELTGFYKNLGKEYKMTKKVLVLDCLLTRIIMGGV